jgi:DNA-binding GntR family transcriptional regulator
MASSLTGPNSAWCFFFLWDYVKSKACNRRPVELNALKQAIRDEINNIAEETLRGMRSYLSRVHLCIHEGCGHLINIVHKKWNNVKQIKTIST